MSDCDNHRNQDFTSLPLICLMDANFGGRHINYIICKPFVQFQCEVSPWSVLNPVWSDFKLNVIGLPHMTWLAKVLWCINILENRLQYARLKYVLNVIRAKLFLRRLLKGLAQSFISSLRLIPLWEVSSLLLYFCFLWPECRKECWERKNWRVPVPPFLRLHLFFPSLCFAFPFSVSAIFFLLYGYWWLSCFLNLSHGSYSIICLF